MACSSTCVRPSTAQAHCGVCHRTFGGLKGFDAHRRDSKCADPKRLGMVLSDRNVWRTPMPEDAIARLEQD